MIFVWPFLNIIMDRYRKIIVLSLKIGIGSSLALYIAESIGLDYAVSAGTITLLTLMTSKWETVKLSVCRLATFTMTVLIAWQVFSHVKSTWISYGILLAIIVFIAEVFEWRSTISVNGVIAAHLVTNRNFSDAAIWNEFLLILIGIIFAVFFNLFQANFSHKKYIVSKMKSVENRLQLILGALAAYLMNRQMKKIRTMPNLAKTVAEYMIYLMDFVTEFNCPEEQMEKLEYIFQLMEEEKLPETHEEFANRALVYHILMDIEDFLKYKIRFIKELDETQLKIYWKR